MLRGGRDGARNQTFGGEKQILGHYFFVGRDQTVQNRTKQYKNSANLIKKLKAQGGHGPCELSLHGGPAYIYEFFVYVLKKMSHEILNTEGSKQH
jgi:hypothetical protein